MSAPVSSSRSMPIVAMFGCALDDARLKGERGMRGPCHQQTVGVGVIRWRAVACFPPHCLQPTSPISKPGRHNSERRDGGRPRRVCRVARREMSHYENKYITPLQIS